MMYHKINRTLAAVIVSLSLLMGTSAHAACAEGTEITGKNGHVYCKSNVSMNWYMAFAWCDTQGRTLATMEQMCDIDETQKWNGIIGTGECLNLVGVSSENQYVWSAIPSGSASAFDVDLSTANVSINASRASNNYALCW